MGLGFHLQSQQLELWHLAQHLRHKGGTRRSCSLATRCAGAPQAQTVALGTAERVAVKPQCLCHTTAERSAGASLGRADALGHRAIAHFNCGLCLLLLQQSLNDSQVRGSDQGTLGGSCPILTPHREWERWFTHWGQLIFPIDDYVEGVQLRFFSKLHRTRNTNCSEHPLWGHPKKLKKKVFVTLFELFLEEG